jgi:hypothetical protein
MPGHDGRAGTTRSEARGSSYFPPASNHETRREFRPMADIYNTVFLARLLADAEGPMFADDVEIIVSADHERVWVNVDGICRFRVHQIKCLTIHDYGLDEAAS